MLPAEIPYKKKLKPPRKYAVGETFPDIRELVEWLEAGLWVYWRGGLKHPSIILNQQAIMLLRGLRAGDFRRALITKEWQCWAPPKEGDKCRTK